MKNVCFCIIFFLKKFHHISSILQVPNHKALELLKLRLHSTFLVLLRRENKNVSQTTLKTRKLVPEYS